MKWKIIIGLVVVAILVTVSWADVIRPRLIGLIEEEAIVPPAATSTPEMMTLKVFFGNRRTDPQALYCERVYPVTREVPKTVSAGQTAIAELLAGPTETERAEGFFTALNSGVTLQSLSIKDGVATADFSSRLGEQVGGSCLVSAIRAEISETLKQFPTVDKVVISINGQVDDILQP